MHRISDKTGRLSIMEISGQLSQQRPLVFPDLRLTRPASPVKYIEDMARSKFNRGAILASLPHRFQASQPFFMSYQLRAMSYFGLLASKPYSLTAYKLSAMLAPPALPAQLNSRYTGLTEGEIQPGSRQELLSPWTSFKKST